MRSQIVRRTNIKLTEREEKYLAYLKDQYTKQYGKTTESDIIRDAIQFLAIEHGFYKGEKLTIIDSSGNWDEV